MKYISKTGTIEFCHPWPENSDGFVQHGTHGVKFPSVIWGDGGTVWHYCGMAWRKRGPAALSPEGLTSFGSFDADLWNPHEAHLNNGH
jgi:hypothetical protein